MSSLSFDAVILDLDGVVTDTARVHAAAWKSLFDGYLRRRAIKYKEDYRPFILERDYLTYLDGKPRYDGVCSFLRARSIGLTYGDPSDGPDVETICGLGNRKDRIFADVLRQEGVRVFDSTIRLVRELDAAGVRRAIASSSKNCQLMLEIAGIEGLFEARVDGVVSARLGLRGKPVPDIFLKCAELLSVSPDRSVIVEDAISGVQAGRSGGFGLVIGVDRTGLGDTLRENGADIVVPDLLNVKPDDINQWFGSKQQLQAGRGKETPPMPEYVKDFETPLS